MIIFAPNVHTGGGKVLLNELIDHSPFGEISHLFLDRRFSRDEYPSHITTYFFEPTFRDRLQALFQLKKLIDRRKKDFSDEVLFFGNVPPFFKFKCKTYLYLQNCFLLVGVPLPKNSIKVFLRNSLERAFLILFRKYVDEIWVQSTWMMALGEKNFPSSVFKRRPFVPSLPIPQPVPKVFDLVSVTSMAPHKNLSTLLDALPLLDAKLTSKKRFLLILDSDSSPSDLKIPQLRNIAVEARNLVTRNELFEYYQKSRLSVVTSSYESFCLPLYESLHFQLQVLALKAPYTHDVANLLHFYETNDPKVLADSLYILMVR